MRTAKNLIILNSLCDILVLKYKFFNFFSIRIQIFLKKIRNS